MATTFAAEALANGAAAVMVSRGPAGARRRCADAFGPRYACGRWRISGRAARTREQRARIIGVTGSVGKTSVKEALKLVFGAQASDHSQRRQPEQSLGPAPEPRADAGVGTSACSRWA
jgi:UDP-N-acetylmuramoyl-tripeptide--D-alanyl-D-alanine ligase